MQPKTIRVFVVEDSPASRELLVHMLHSDPQIKVIGTAKDGEEAVEFLKSEKPDVITMDIHMPGMDGFETTRKIMETDATPVVIVSSTTDPRQVAITFRAMEAGAVAVLPMPPGIGHPEHESAASELIRTVKLMSEVKVVRRWPRSRAVQREVQAPAKVAAKGGEIQIVAIGASTGGPPVLQTILSNLPKDFPFPVLIVQHIAAGFLDGFVGWLNSQSKIQVRVAIHKEPILPGYAYVAPDDFHMLVAPGNSIVLRKEAPDNGLRPSVSRLFRSVADVFGKNSVGILLSGMGKDGAQELKQIKTAGGITIAQSSETCVVNGMPGEAVKLEAATYVLPPERIAAVLASIAKTL